MGDLAFWGFEEEEAQTPCTEATQAANSSQDPPLNLLSGSITGDPARRPLRVRADFVTCTQ